MVARWIPFAASGVAVVAVGLLVAVVVTSATDDPGPSLAQAPQPPLAAEPTGPGTIGLVDPEWVSSTAAATGIPREAVLAYAGAALGAAEIDPECGLGWNTLAGIGYTESDHGRHGGATFEPSGHVSPKIFGVPLDGTSTEHIPDTDGGEFDETADIDRAIGPMQIIPQTWASWISDGNGDGVADPQNIADSAIAAANHMCRASGEMSTADGWRDGIAAYNSGGDYLRKVASAAQRYFDASPVE